MKAQKTSFFKKFYTASLAALFVLPLVSLDAFANGFGGARIWRGGNAEPAPEAQIIRGLTVLGDGNLGGHQDEDCDDPRQRILDEYLTEVDIIGPTDDRDELADQTERPYVAAIGYEHNGEWITFGNGWQTQHPRLLVLPAHLMADDGNWLINGSSETPSAEDLSVYQTRIAGCPNEEPYTFQEIGRVGSLDPSGPHEDYVVVMLDRDSCLAESQLARTLNMSEENRQQFLFAENAPLQGRLDAYMDRSLIGNTVPDDIGEQVTNGVEWIYRDGAVHSSTGNLGGYGYYQIVDGQRFHASAADWGARNVHRYFRYYGDADQGNSGGAVSAVGQVELNGQTITVDHVVGMQISEDGRAAVEENRLLIYEGQFQVDVEGVAEELRRLDLSTDI